MKKDDSCLLLGESGDRGKMVKCWVLLFFLELYSLFALSIVFFRLLSFYILPCWKLI